MRRGIGKKELRDRRRRRNKEIKGRKKYREKG
jgi:hypothetical protein